MSSKAQFFRIRVTKVRIVLCAALIGHLILALVANNILQGPSIDAPAGRSPGTSLHEPERIEHGYVVDRQDLSLTECVHLAAEYLARSTTSEGQFIYRINLDPDFPPKPKYNVVRHAGTVYSLARYQFVSPRDEIRDAMVRAGEFLKRETIAPVGEANATAIWSRPELNNSGEPLQAKLGGTGLGLVALLSIEQLEPGFTQLDELQKLGRFILFMQKADGGFYSKYIPREGGRSDNWVSLYYPGEAALGLVMLYELDPQPKWLSASVQAMTYLARRRQHQEQVEADHWALLATARLLPVMDSPADREILLSHARQICTSILAETDGRPRHSHASLGFSADGRTCPTATRLEGLLSALSFLPRDETHLRQQIVDRASEGIAFLQKSQIVDGPFSGGIPRATCRLAATDPSFSHAFNRRATEVRIDYVQHALCAMMEFQRVRMERDQRISARIEQ